MRQHELEADDQHTGEGSELEHGLPPWHESERDACDHQQALEDALDDVQVGQAARVVLAPIPERERGLAVDLAS